MPIALIRTVVGVFFVFVEFTLWYPPAAGGGCLYVWRLKGLKIIWAHKEKRRIGPMTESTCCTDYILITKEYIYTQRVVRTIIVYDRTLSAFKEIRLYFSCLLNFFGCTLCIVVIFSLCCDV